MSNFVLSCLCETLPCWMWVALIAAQNGSCLEKIQRHWIAEEGWKGHCCLLPFSPPQAALRALSVPFLTWWATATWLFCFLFHPTLTLLGWLQASQQCKRESGKNKNEDQTKPKAVSEQVSGTNGWLRAQKRGFLLLMPLRRMWKAALASERDYDLIHLDPPHECRGGSSSYNQALSI